MTLNYISFLFFFFLIYFNLINLFYNTKLSKKKIESICWALSSYTIGEKFYTKFWNILVEETEKKNWGALKNFLILFDDLLQIVKCIVWWCCVSFVVFVSDLFSDKIKVIVIVIIIKLSFGNSAHYSINLIYKFYTNRRRVFFSNNILTKYLNFANFN